MGYKEKIEIILGNKLEFNGDNQKAIDDVKIWLCCEWQCGMIEDMSDYTELVNLVDYIADRIIKTL